MVTCTNLTKSYGKHDAVSHLAMNLTEKTIYGLLGRNGAGKTTLLNMITGGIFPSYGQIEIAGSRLRIGETPQDVCYIREKNLFFGSAKVMEILQLASVFHKNWDWTFAHELLRTFNLNPNKKIRQLSRGMESLVGNIIGLASRAPLTIYDEPVLGLDVLMRERFYRILLQDEVDHLRNQSHLLTGEREAIEIFINGRQVIYKEAHGKGFLAAVYGPLGDADRQQAHKLGISIEGLPLQKFFSYLIEGGQRIE